MRRLLLRGGNPQCESAVRCTGNLYAGGGCTLARLRPLGESYSDTSDGVGTWRRSFAAVVASVISCRNRSTRASSSGE